MRLGRAVRDDAEARAAIGRQTTTGAGEAKLMALPTHDRDRWTDIHFIHVRSKHENALPLIVTHGWPGFGRRTDEVIDPLTNPHTR